MVDQARSWWRFLKPPSMVEHPWPWVIALAFYSVLLTLGTVWWMQFPAKAPVAVLGHVQSWTDDGLWRIESVVRVQGQCDIAVERRFDIDGGTLAKAERSYLDPRKTGDVPWLVRATVPDNGKPATIWYEYRVGPEYIGTSYLLEARAFECENGFAGLIERQNITVQRP